ncbi:basic salivary proline-rich protein 1-like isoform X4 [Canis lupus familiaris]|uniref:basic salivary proline-rich protein 1-like isoform X4 n=1 Tax=Canis lupus familiaris TaxID=9615 RepID=UPI0018F4A17C|nr:basic salivary proline-rich protein 1-like isoform X4 [Canis lupus familiaris]XP_038387887.1 basic salivary proline-rich protein 1-like isoform X4 [Canis lupus familiaris]XP_038387888.1 basic salivary proline-rich protein 1-like isoform X4 [Canis lupus familiaris]
MVPPFTSSFLKIRGAPSAGRVDPAGARPPDPDRRCFLPSAPPPTRQASRAWDPAPFLFPVGLGHPGGAGLSAPQGLSPGNGVRPGRALCSAQELLPWSLEAVGLARGETPLLRAIGPPGSRGGPRSQPWATRQAREPRPRSPATWARVWPPGLGPHLHSGSPWRRAGARGAASGSFPGPRPPARSRPGPAPRWSHCVTPGGVRRQARDQLPSLVPRTLQAPRPSRDGRDPEGPPGNLPQAFSLVPLGGDPERPSGPVEGGDRGRTRPCPWGSGTRAHPTAAKGLGSQRAWGRLAGPVPPSSRRTPDPRRAPALQADAGFRGSLRNPSPRGGRRPAGTAVVGLHSGTASVATTCATPAPAQVRPACTPLLCEPVTGTWKPRGRPAHGQHGDTRGHRPDLAGLATVPGGCP